METNKVEEFFFIHPSAKIHLRDLARQVKLSHTWIQKIIGKYQYIHKEKKGNLVVLSIDHDSPLFKEQKLVYNLSALYQSEIIQLLIEEYEHPEAIVLFGSYRFGEDREESDIDIAVITKRHKNISLQKLEKKLKRKISLQEVERPSKEFLTTLANGIVLSGYLRFV